MMSDEQHKKHLMEWTKEALVEHVVIQEKHYATFEAELIEKLDACRTALEISERNCFRLGGLLDTAKEEAEDRKLALAALEAENEALYSQLNEALYVLYADIREAPRYVIEQEGEDGPNYVFMYQGREGENPCWVVGLREATAFSSAMDCPLKIPGGTRKNSREPIYVNSRGRVIARIKRRV
jgi:hypothetical protein